MQSDEDEEEFDQDQEELGEEAISTTANSSIAGKSFQNKKMRMDSDESN